MRLLLSQKQPGPSQPSTPAPPSATRCQARPHPQTTTPSQRSIPDTPPGSAAPPLAASAASGADPASVRALIGRGLLDTQARELLGIGRAEGLSDAVVITRFEEYLAAVSKERGIEKPDFIAFKRMAGFRCAALPQRPAPGGRGVVSRQAQPSREEVLAAIEQAARQRQAQAVGR
jgi:hypothetical protein